MIDISTIIVFSHLRWDFVFQRPQHILSRLASAHPILFIEEPVYHPGPPSWQQTRPMANVRVLRPRTPVEQPGFCDAQMPVLRGLVAQLAGQVSGQPCADLSGDVDGDNWLDNRRDNWLDSCLAWFYTPSALPLLSQLRPRAVVYDCMDELSGFLGAPADIREREAALLDRADVVFTGGPSLYKAKKHLHGNVHCFPSSVDIEHFAQAAGTLAEAEDQAAVPGPRLGFFGVIDERMDVDLVDELSRTRPDWQIVLVGPVVKIDDSRLPRRPNLRYLGQRPYQRLPEYLAGWDVCLLPFARNRSTRFISPTKTLEYMAAEKPIVSTRITDVAEPYGDIVHIADTAEDFIAACQRALDEDAGARTRRIERMRDVLGMTSWDRTVASMAREIAGVLGRSGRRASRAMRATGMATGMASGSSRQATPPVTVIGAGPTGLNAARELGSSALLLEQHDRVGGWCRSVEDRGFTFDHAGHIMFSKDPYVHELYAQLLGDNLHWQDREAWIFSKGVYSRYPFQGALYGLPPEVAKECIVGAIEARFGRLDGKPGAAGPDGHDTAAAPGSGRAGDSATCRAVTDCCADGVMESTVKLAAADTAGGGRREPKNFEEFIYSTWGWGIARHFAIPYNTKLWAVPLAEMETSWLGGRVPMPDLEEMIEGALKPVPRPMGPNARFGYPLRGGFQALMNGFLPLLGGPLRLGARVTAVSPGRHTVTINDEEEIRYQYLINTMPLPVLVRLMGDEAPARVRQAARRLRSVSVRCVNIGVGREKLTEKHWIYYPEDTVFHRIFVQGNASPQCNPPGGFGLTCEITYSEHKPLPCDGDALIERCIRDCHRVGMFTPDDAIWASNQVDLPHAYVVYDHARAESVATIRQWLGTQDIILAGRYSEWEYYNSDHAFVAGKRAADTARELLGESQPGVRSASVPV